MSQGAQSVLGSNTRGESILQRLTCSAAVCYPYLDVPLGVEFCSIMFSRMSYATFPRSLIAVHLSAI